MTDNPTEGGTKPPGMPGNARKPRAKRHTQPTGHLPVGKRPKKKPGAPRSNGAAEAKRLEAAAKRKKAAWTAIELKSQGASLETIAEKLGYANKSSVSRLIDQEMAATPVEKIDTLRRIEERHLSWIRRKLISIAKDEDESAHDRVDALKGLVSLAARKAKIFGLDAPTQTELTGKDGGPVQVNDLGSQDVIRKRLAALREELLGPGVSGESERAPDRAAIGGGTVGDAPPEGAGEPPSEAGSDTEG